MAGPAAGCGRRTRARSPGSAPGPRPVRRGPARPARRPPAPPPVCCPSSAQRPTCPPRAGSKPARGGERPGPRDGRRGLRDPAIQAARRALWLPCAIGQGVRRQTRNSAEEFVSSTRMLKSRRAAPGVRAAVAAVAVMLVGASTASAAPAPVVSKLTAPLGAIQAPDGRWWVSDHLAGFCRVAVGTTAAPGAIETATCLGGGVPVLPGPASAGEPVFHDPTPAAPNSGDEMAYVPDGATGSRSVDRLAWNPASQTFSMVDAVSLVGADPDQRPAYAALGPDGNLYVGTLRTTAIQRIVDPEGAAPTAEVVGNIDRLAGLAAGRDAAGRLALYSAEPTGVTRLYPDAAAPAASQPTTMALGLANAATPYEPGALAYDMAANALYVGTASAAHAGPVDKVMRFAIAGGTPAGETPDTRYDPICGLRPPA